MAGAMMIKELSPAHLGRKWRLFSVMDAIWQGDTLSPLSPLFARQARA